MGSHSRSTTWSRSRSVSASGSGSTPGAPLHFEALEHRTLFCDWGWLEAVGLVSPSAGLSASADGPAALPVSARAADYAHGGALHVDASSLQSAVVAAPPRPAPTLLPGPEPTPVPPAPTPAPGTTTLRIETGGSASFTDSAGRTWSADSGFSGGTASTGVYSVGGTSDDKLYYTRRWGNFSYARAVTNGLYTLRLHFADPLYTAPGFRLFDAWAEGAQVLNDFDIAANGGGKAALVKVFDVSVTDGRLDLSFRGVRENAILSAVELVPAGTAPEPASKVPAAPSGAKVNAGLSRVAVSWVDRSSNELGFRIERKEGAGGYFKQIASAGPNATTYVDDKNLKAGVAYYYRVRAYNSAGSSSASAESPAATVSISSITWKTGAPSPITRAEAARGVVNGKVYVFGGYYNADIQATKRTDVYDPATNTWRRLADMPVAITHQGMVVEGTTVWLVGGYVGNHPGPGTKQVWKYDTLKNTWSRGPDLPESRGAGAAAIVGRRVYFFGGMNESRTKDMTTAWVLNLDKQSAGWLRIADMPNGRNHLTGISYNGKVYAIGGHWQQEWEAVTQSEVDEYDPATNSWKRVADTPTLRSQTPAATVVWKDKIILVGGADRTQNSTTAITAYVPSEDRWEDIGRLPAARRATVAAIVGNRLIVTTGNDPYPSTTTWISSLLE